MPTFAEWITLPENRAAHEGAVRTAQSVCSGSARRALNPLFLHGPSGSGKSHLAAAVLSRVAHNAADRTMTVLAAGDLDPTRQGDEESKDLLAARRADLIVIEDVQHLPPRAAENLVQTLDRAAARQQQLLLTAASGPAQLTRLPARLTSRLAQGLVVELLPLSPASRLLYLERRAEARGLTIARPVLEWLAAHVPGSGRALDGALTRLTGLTKLHGVLPDLAVVVEQFRDEAEARRPTVERIAQRVGRYFRLEPAQLQGRDRRQGVLLPRQIGMYLARHLTSLSLQQIGAYFGGRDHSTVLHACRKVEQALTNDLTLSGAIRQLHADLA